MEPENDHNLSSTIDIERHKIALDIHDTIGQSLVSARLLAYSLLSAIKNQEPNKETLLEIINELLLGIESATDDLHKIVNKLHIKDIENKNLAEAVVARMKSLFGKAGINYELHPGNSCQIDCTATRAEIFHIIEEAITNIVKHSGANQVIVRFDRKPKVFKAKITDNGIGFNKKIIVPSQTGLSGMKERINRLGGKIQIRSQPGKGTTISFQAPLILDP